MMKRIAGGALALILGVSAARAQRADYEARCAEARTLLVHGLEEHASWCGSKKLFLERQHVLERLLELDPDNADARKTLGHTRTRDGWKKPEGGRPPRDYDDKALEQAPAHERQALAPYLEALVALLEEPGLDLAQRDPLAAEVLRFDPDNERVHALLGEVKSDKGWVIPETLRARERRAELRGFVREALESPPPATPTPLVEREQGIALQLRAVATPGLRVVGTADEEELRLTAQAVGGIERLLQLSLGTPYALKPGATVFMLADPAHRQAFLEGHPAITDELRPWFATLEGAGIPGTADFAFWTGDSQRRIDGVVRLVLGYLMSGAYGITVENGWAYEGFGLVLTRSLIRSRMTWLAAPTSVPDPTDLALRQKLLDPETNWLAEALARLEAESGPFFPALLKKSAGELSTKELLYSYVLATYLLEVRWEQAGPMLTKVGRGLSASAALQEALGMNLETFRRHLVRWLEERS